jgi:hypothetical protein
MVMSLVSLICGIGVPKGSDVSYGWNCCFSFLIFWLILPPLPPGQDAEQQKDLVDMPGFSWYN